MHMPIQADYLERIYAGVLGKLIGVYLGRPFEGWTKDRILKKLGPIEYYVHDRMDVPLVVTDDDVAGTFVFLRALEDNSFDPNLRAEQIGHTWLNYLVERRTILWWGGLGNSTEHTAYLRLKSGMHAPGSGSIATNGRTVAEQIGAQIFIDGWAMVSPGNPSQAARLAREASLVSHDGEAVHAAVLLAVMEAQAFVEGDIDRLIDLGLSFIPADSLIARLVGDVRTWHREHPRWEDAFSKIEEHYGYHLFPGNCHVVPNHAVVIMSLLYGGDDFQRGQMIANTAGWDTDCNAGNVGCLTGIRLGLPAIDAGPDWRGPIADRLFLSSADGGSAIADAVGVSYGVARAGWMLAGETPPTAPKDGARFHFSLPGSVQGFAAAEGGARVCLQNVVQASGSRALSIACAVLDPAEVVRVFTPTFIPRDVDRMRTYDLLASPTLNPGQTVRAHVKAVPHDGGAIEAALSINVYDSNGAIETVTGDFIVVSGEGSTIAWTVPDLGGRPIAEAGIALRGSSGKTVVLDWLDWDGTPELRLGREPGGGEFWRRAWVDAVTTWAKNPYGHAFRLSQEQGHGLLIYGTRDWRDYRVNSRLAVNLGRGGLAARVQGLRRYYALQLEPCGKVQLIRAYDDDRVVLAEAPFDWQLDDWVDLELDVRGTSLRGLVNGKELLQAEDSRLSSGAIALACSEGTLSTEEVRVSGALGA
jgi:ADP-ribosylglycohydrolase